MDLDDRYGRVLKLASACLISIFCGSTLNCLSWKTNFEIKMTFLTHVQNLLMYFITNTTLR